jgi:6-pyruvoyltetrahydropterin/6-carboxytetrahydropterin synthase
MKVTVFKEFTIEAAHRLPHVPTEHKCFRLHGHSFRVEVHVSGPVRGSQGWILDIGDITSVFDDTIHAHLDHQYLNDVPGLENPTSENLARWIWERLHLPGLSKVVVRETCTSGCIYEGES